MGYNMELSLKCSLRGVVSAYMHIDTRTWVSFKCPQYEFSIMISGAANN